MFSYIGFTPEKKKIDKDGRIDIVMSEDSQLLNEVVVIGYGTMDKKELTSAISHVSEKDFLTISSSDPAMLKAKFPEFQFPIQVLRIPTIRQAYRFVVSHLVQPV